MSQASDGALAHELIIIPYFLVGSVAVCIWDIVNNLQKDYYLVFKQRFSPATIAFLASRIGSLMYSLGITIFATSLLPNCDAAFGTFSAFYPFAVSGSAFLFFVRVRAIYAADRFITFLFGFLWLAVLATSIAVPVSSAASSLGDACVLTQNARYGRSTSVTIAVHDTCVFFAISYRLVANSAETGSTQPRLKLFRVPFDGAKNMPSFSKALFVDGQIYYMITLLTNLTTTILVFLPTRSIGLYHGAMTIPNVVLTSIMACRVYRRTKLALVDPHAKFSLALPTLNPVSATGGVVHPVEFALQPRSRGGGDDDAASGHSDSRSTNSRNGDDLGGGASSKTNGGTLDFLSSKSSKTHPVSSTLGSSSS